LLITVSRQTGSYGQEICDRLAEKLSLRVITRDLVIKELFPDIATPHELHMLSESPGYFSTTSSLGITFTEHLENELRKYVTRHSAIIFGLGAQIIFAEHPTAFHVKIMASHEVRVDRIMRIQGLVRHDAERFLELSDRKHKRYISTLYAKDWSDPSLYHVTINTDHMSIEEAVELIIFGARNRDLFALSNTGPSVQLPDTAVVFKNQSEEEFAKILDMHHIDWEYEPRTFPIKWDTEGNVTQAFSPDFYLPRFNTYIELTTMNQRYVAEKKKKVQLLKKLYPGTNINIVFKNDFHTLAKRFGLEEDADS